MYTPRDIFNGSVIAVLVAKEIINRIDEIVERAYVDFTFDIIGDDFFTDEQKIMVASLGLIIGRRPLIELIYILVRQRSTPGYRTDRTLNQLLTEIAQTGVLPVLNDTHQYSIDHSKSQINEAIEDTKQQIKKRVNQEILNVNNDFKNEVAVERLTVVPLMREKTERHLGALLLGLAAVGVVVQSGFVRAFTTALTETANNAAVDEATTIAALPGVDRKDIRVYKRVINDVALCPWCDAFYTGPDGKPKIYSLEELKANGSNHGRPKSAWQPVIGVTHPRCRCQLHYLSDEIE